MATIGHLGTLPRAYSCLQYSQEMPVAEDIVFDVHKDNLIKTTEREDRGVASGIAHGSILVGHMIQW